MIVAYMLFMLLAPFRGDGDGVPSNVGPRPYAMLYTPFGGVEGWDIPSIEVM